MDYLPHRRRFRLTWRSCLMLVAELAVLSFALWRLWAFYAPQESAPAVSFSTAIPPTPLRDVLPTPTPDASRPLRFITFPSAAVSAPIIPAGRVGGTWETRHLGNSVGHLVGTSWIDEAGGNVVLAGHVESYTGEPGPFAYLFEAQIGDLVIISEGGKEYRYRVSQIEKVPPDDVSWLAQDGRPRLTLITCTDWDWELKTYHGRLVVVAEPLAPSSP